MALKKHFITYVITFAIWSVFVLAACSQELAKVNQIGFYPRAEKIAVVPGNVSGQFHLVDVNTDEVVYTGTLSAPRQWTYSGETVALADFSEFSTPGTYRIEHPEGGSSYQFEIKDHVHHEIARAALRAYYYNRASTALETAFAGVWARPAGHPDTSVIVHSSAATAERPAGYRFSSPKGWYDAGDYNKYIVNSGISTYTLLAAYEHFPEYYQNLSLNIPESGNNVPDILDEARWNIDWMLTMQDPNDGGVYHKLTSLNFSGIVMPHQDNLPRYVVMKTTAATLNFAAVMAVAARVYAPYDQSFADNCLEAAEYAWQWAIDHPAVYYRQPSDVHTGEYRDSNVQDEFDWAAAELYITTKNDSYWHARNFQDVGVPSWQFVRPLAWVSLAHHRNNLTPAANVQLIQQRIINQGYTLRNEYRSSAYKVSMGHVPWDFVWGSNGVAGNHSLMLVQAYRLTGDTSYLHAAQANLDYILGRNATGYSFVTGYGSHTPMNPHHRPSAADGIPRPVPGFVVGGPQSGQQDNCPGYPSNLPALSYLDDWCSYSTNEVAINWNASLVYVSGALEAIYGGNQPPTSKNDNPAVPTEFALRQNYPNPFNPVTMIRYELPVRSRVSLRMFDVLGREVSVLVDQYMPAGTHEVQFDASRLSTGVYLCRLEAAGILSFGKGFSQTRQMVLIR